MIINNINVPSNCGLSIINCSPCVEDIYTCDTVGDRLLLLQWTKIGQESCWGGQYWQKMLFSCYSVPFWLPACEFISYTTYCSSLFHIGCMPLYRILDLYWNPFRLSECLLLFNSLQLKSAYMCANVCILWLHVGLNILQRNDTWQ